MKKEEIVMGLYAMRLKGKNRVAQERNNTVDMAVKLIDQLDEPEKPVIPDFMAYWIEENEHLTLMYIGFKLFSNRIKDEDVNDWISDNQEQFSRAFLAWPNVEVEKEKKYIIKFAPSVFGTSTYGSIGTQNGKKIMQSVYGSQEGIIIPNQYTRREIEEVGSKYMIFAEEVTE